MRILLVSEGMHEQSGALESLVSRLVKTQIDCKHERVQSIHASHGKGDGYFKKAVGCLREAQNKGYDALILLIDEDGQKERRKQLDNAQNCQLFNLPRALGVAIRSFDAWILADEGALTEVLKYQVFRQPEPETISDPKNKCKVLHDGSSREIKLREMYSEVASVTDLELLNKRCPHGFAPFAERVRLLV